MTLCVSFRYFVTAAQNPSSSRNRVQTDYGGAALVKQGGENPDGFHTVYRVARSVARSFGHLVRFSCSLGEGSRRRRRRRRRRGRRHVTLLPSWTGPAPTFFRDTADIGCKQDQIGKGRNLRTMQSLCYLGRGLLYFYRTNHVRSNIYCPE